MAATFVDTNVLLYAASNAPAEKVKTAEARRIVKDDDIVLSAQVLQEFYWVSTRPNKLALTHNEALRFIDTWKMFPVQAITLGIVEEALVLCRKYHLSYWDAAIVAAARHMNCGRLYTEDLADGQDYDGVTAINPFPTK